MSIGIARYDGGKLRGMLERKRLKIAERLDKHEITQEQLDVISKNLNMDIIEHARFQELKSLAYAMDKMRLEDAQLLYELLGESCDVFNNQPIHIKAVLMSIFKELLEKYHGS